MRWPPVALSCPPTSRIKTVQSRSTMGSSFVVCLTARRPRKSTPQPTIFEPTLKLMTILRWRVEILAAGLHRRQLMRLLSGTRRCSLLSRKTLAKQVPLEILAWFVLRQLKQVPLLCR
ncbi:hypothetical protein BDV29DRAFT_184790 [Aspergillus leporis]|uniref:Uncharacterized protein n=1 Tax=Aspergillus leporis TaxID=41062 RepID=A0A5N5WM88_9EURO|nr:hypothetical protein BDV29DRAFT_184790 [Aspergillus leporis]